MMSVYYFLFYYINDVLFNCLLNVYLYIYIYIYKYFRKDEEIFKILNLINQILEYLKTMRYLQKSIYQSNQILYVLNIAIIPASYY